jgi:hypothetical protein
MNEPQFIKEPLVIIHAVDGDLHTMILPRVAGAFKVSEDEVWEWVVKERHHHTTNIKRPS